MSWDKAIMNDNLLHIKNLKTYFHTGLGVAKAVNKATFVGEDDVVTAEIHTGDGRGIERQVGLVMAMNARRVVEPRRANIPAAISLRHQVWCVDGGKNRRAGVHGHGQHG